MNVLHNNISTFFLLLFFFRKSSDKLKIYINKSVFMKKREKNHERILDFLCVRGYDLFNALISLTLKCLKP